MLVTCSLGFLGLSRLALSLFILVDYVVRKAHNLNNTLKLWCFLTVVKTENPDAGRSHIVLHLVCGQAPCLTLRLWNLCCRMRYSVGPLTFTKAVMFSSVCVLTRKHRTLDRSHLVDGCAMKESANLQNLWMFNSWRWMKKITHVWGLVILSVSNFVSFQVKFLIKWTVVPNSLV